MAKSRKRDEPLEGCMFCTDPDFALRHTMEDDALLRIAEAANDVVQLGIIGNIGPLRDALNAFAALDAAVDEQKRAVEGLRAIEAELG